MRRTVVWSTALVVVVLMVGVASYSAMAATGAPRAAAWRSQAWPTISPQTSDWAAAAITPPPGGIPRHQAVAIAERQMHLGADALESAIVGHFGSFTGGVAMGSPTDLLVWAVTFRGVFPHPCMAPPSPCVPAHHASVLLDYFTGTALLFIDRE